MELRVGLKFPSYEELANFIKLYEFKTKQKYWKRSSRTIENARLRRPCNENLKYYEIRYSCMYGGKKFITLKSKGLEKVSSQRMDCPAYIKIRASEDGQFLEIKHYIDKHENHAQLMLEDDVEDYDNFLTMHRSKRRKRGTSSQNIHFGPDNLSSSLITKQEDGDVIDDEHTKEDYVQPKTQSSTSSHDCSNIENQVTSQTGQYYNKLTNDDFFMQTNQIQQVDNLEARGAENIFLLNNEQTSQIAPKEINQQANQYSHTMSLCVLCAEDVSNNQLKKSVKEFLILILDITSIDVTQYPFESNCCETCYQFLMQIKDFQKRVKAASLLINQKLQETSKEIEFVSFTEENLPTTSSVEECNIFPSTEYPENEYDQYAQSLVQTDENMIIKSEDTQNIFTNVNEDICDAIKSVNEDDQQIIEDTNQLSIKTEFEEMDNSSIQIDELNEDESNLEPIKAEYLTSSMNQYLSKNNPFSALGMNAEDEENEVQCGSYEEFLKETNENECEESDVEESFGIPPDIVDAANNSTLNVLPKKSRQTYELSYIKFKQWCENKKIKEITEDVLVGYFSEMAEQLKPSSLWSKYSMLKASLTVKDDIDIKRFSKLTSFLKWKSTGYRAEKSKTFSRDEIIKFLLQAPDDKYLMMKVVLILGVAGACRRDELCKMSIDDFEDTGTAIIVNIPKSETDKERYFVIRAEHEDLNIVNIFRKYATLRPVVTEHRRFFLCYKQGQCTARPVGVHTFGKIPSNIAKYLELNNPHSYTGYCFRRSSGMLLANAGADVLSLKRHGGWKSKGVPESYIKESLENGKEIAENDYEESDVEECLGIPQHITDATNNATLNVLPEKSRQIYELTYSKFKQWCESKKVREITENVLLRYFSELSKQLKSPSLWSKYSMLKASLKIKDGIDIKKFLKLTAFLKWNSRGYSAEKSKTFSRDEVKRFLLQAPDDKYLMMKVALILGVAGACSRDELCKISVDDLEDTGTIIIVNIPNNETNKGHYFVIQGENEGLNMANIFRKYARLRPAAVEHQRFFLCYKEGQCTVRPVGVHTFGKIPSDIAKYLGLNNPNSYTGHCFRRSSGTLLANAGADILSLKRREGWKSKTLAKRYIKESLENKRKIASRLLSGNVCKQNTLTVTNIITKGKKKAPVLVPSFIPSSIDHQQESDCEESDVEECSGIPQDTTDAANNTTLNVLPEKSRQLYESTYSKFKQWCENKKVREITENALLEYFSEMGGQLKSSSLWAKYSMLKASLEVKDAVNIKKFSKLTAFLKWKSRGYCAQKSNTFSRDEIKKFLLQAPDNTYLMMKVVLIVGVAGACSRDELCKISVDDLEDTGSIIIVNVPKSETNKERYFIIHCENEDLNMAYTFRKYASLRPATTEHRRFFLYYKQGQCTVRPVGINTFGKIPSDIAKYLGLNNPFSYTGHCFRRSSATLLADAGADLLSIKRHGGWKSKGGPESYIKESRENRKQIADQLLSEKEKTSTVAHNAPLPVPSSSVPFNINLQQKNDCEESDVEEESFGIPPNFADAANNTTLTVLPEKSRQKYELVYSKFKQWCENKDIKGIRENVLLEYFSEMGGLLKSSSLWAKYSMLKASLEVKDGVNIKGFSKLTAFLKWKSTGYHAKKSNTFSRNEIKRFLLQAPDDKYLMMKVVLILGVAGAFRRDELCKVSTDDFEDTGTIIIVNTPKSDTNRERYFVIQSENEDLNMAAIFRKYAALRPTATEHRRFFLCYKDGQCTVRPVGINTFGKIPSDIAKYLGLNNPHNYTGHCFRRSSVSLFANTGANVLSLKKHGGWKSKVVAESYIKGSLENKKKIANQLLSGNGYVQNIPAVADAVTKDDVCRRQEPYHCPHCNSAFDTELGLDQHECLHSNSYATSSVSSNQIPTGSLSKESTPEDIKFLYSTS